MAVFNSLGSNYSKQFMWKSLFAVGSTKYKEELRQKLSDHYQGKTTLTYKGRQALELALKNSGLPKKSQIGISGFTCYVVYQAVINAGFEPIFIDIAEDEIHFSVAELKHHQNLKAIIIQNTLGLPADMPAIIDYCQKHKILIVEDLAHSVGAKYPGGKETGTVGELVKLSFSQDKPLDVVAGGAFIDRRSDPPSLNKLPAISHWQRWRNHFYPFWTSIIRATYGVGLGRYIHFALKKLHWLATPMSDNLSGIYQMPKTAARLLLDRWQNQSQELTHRQKIAKIYQENLPKTLQFNYHGQPSFLRFPLRTDKRDWLIDELKKQKIYIGDTWYDAPIAPSRYLQKTNYQKGQCPRAEKLADEIINLPTHQAVSEQTARDICAKINQYLDNE